MSKLSRLKPGCRTTPCPSKQLNNPARPSSGKRRGLPRQNPKLFRTPAVGAVLWLEAQRGRGEPGAQSRWAELPQEEKREQSSKPGFQPSLSTGFAPEHGHYRHLKSHLRFSFLFSKRRVPGTNEKSPDCFPLTVLKRVRS